MNKEDLKLNWREKDPTYITCYEASERLIQRKKISDIHKKFNKLVDYVHEKEKSKTPHVCPVCNGKTRTHYYTLSSSFVEEQCRSCNGIGIIWG